MLAQHFVDVEPGRDAGILLQLPNLDHARAGILEDQAQFARADDARGIADRGIAGDAALETGRGAVIVADLADQVDLCDCDLLLVTLQRIGAQRHVGDQPDQERLAGAHAEELADRGAGFFGPLRRCRRQADTRLRAAHGNDAADEVQSLRCSRRSLGITDRHKYLRSCKGKSGG